MENEYVCPGCGKMTKALDFEGYVCKECYRKSIKPHPIRRNKQSIEDIDKEAREKGMSYGQYVAMMRK